MITTLEDTRLDPLDNWERLDRLTIRSSLYSSETKITDEEMKLDPKFLSEALRARGVHLRIFCLV